jgi:polysaccharide biosynthesis transport protein
MTEAPRYASLRDYLRVLRDQRLLILAVALVFGAAAFALSARQAKQYVAEASVGYQDENVDSAAFGTFPPATAAPDQRAAVAAQTINRPELVGQVRRVLATPVSVGRLRGALSVRPEQRTNLVVIQATWPDPAFAAKLANATAEQARTAAIDTSRRRYAIAKRQLQRSLRGLGHTRSADLTRTEYEGQIARLDALSRFSTPARIVDRATPPALPAAPRPKRNTLLGLLLGLTIGVLAAFVRDALDRRLRSGGDIRQELELPVLAHIGEGALGRTLASSNGHKPLTDADFEAFRILRTNLDFLDADRPPGVVVVTSALPEEGKSTVATSLASAYVLAGRRTLLVECDLRRPTLAKRLGLRAGPGLTDHLTGQAGPDDVLRTVPLAKSENGEAAAPTLVCITAGGRTPRPAELLASKRFAAFLAEVREAYDVVVLDTTPLLSVVDALELLRHADGVVVCVRAARTTREQARAARAALQRMPQRPAGVVVTGVRAGDELDYGSYSYAYAETVR